MIVVLWMFSVRCDKEAIRWQKESWKAGNRDDAGVRCASLSGLAPLLPSTSRQVFTVESTTLAVLIRCRILRSYSSTFYLYACYVIKRM